MKRALAVLGWLALGAMGGCSSPSPPALGGDVGSAAADALVDVAADAAGPGGDAQAIQDGAPLADGLQPADAAKPTDVAADAAGNDGSDSGDSPFKTDVSAADGDATSASEVATPDASPDAAPDATPAACPYGKTVLPTTGDASARGAAALQDGALLVGRHKDGAELGTQGWLARVDAGGALLWQQDTGGPGEELLYALTAAADGTWVAVGDVKQPGQPWDGLVVRFSAKGQVLSVLNVGGDGNEELYGVAAVGDGLALVGTIDDAGGTPRLWVVRTASDGKVMWDKTFGTSDLDVGFAIAALPGGDLAVAGEQAPGGIEMAWLMRISGTGEPLWSKAVHTAGTETGWGLALLGAANPKLVICGATRAGAGDKNGWLGAFDGQGAPSWQAELGAAGTDDARAVVADASGGILATGRSDVGATQGAGIWRLDATGKVAWQVAVPAPSGLKGQTYAVSATPAVAWAAAVGWAAGEVSGASGVAPWVLRFDPQSGAVGCP